MIRRALLASLALGTLATAAELDWHKVIQPAHRPSVDRPLEHIAEVHASLDAATREKDAQLVEQVRTLVTRTSLSFTDAELPGKWKCRSIQGGEGGIFIYPYFAASIEPREGRLFLRKSSGSQFRQGFLHPDGENKRRIFLGIQYVAGDKPGSYSGTYPKDEVDGESLKFDSVGVLVKKGPGHFLLLLDATPTAYELYEFRR